MVRWTIALTSLFFLTVMIIGFDDTIRTDLRDNMVSIASDRTTEIDGFVNAWTWWVGPFLLAIFVYIIIGGLSPSNVTEI